MKKFYSLVLMAAALLIGTNMWATVRTAGNSNELKAAWEAAQDGDEIKLTADFSIGTTLWLGTEKMNDTPMSITFNLNGDTLTSTAEKVFVITHGELKVIGNGGIKHDIPYSSAYDPAAENGAGEYKSKYEIFRLLGSTYKDINPKTDATYYSHLSIGVGVKLVAAVNGIVVDQCGGAPFTTAWAAGNKTVPTWANLNSTVYHHDKPNQATGDRGVANGVCIDVEGTIIAAKYAIKSNGNLGSTALYPLASYAGKYYQAPGVTYAVEAGDNNYSPFIHVYSTATLLTNQFGRTDAVAAYSGGYARWLVEGHVEGSTAVYVKSGEIDLKSATITSNFTGTASGSTADRGSGVDAGGSGLVIESSANYAGDTEVKVEGNTVITPTSGYALEEKITNVADTSKVDNVTIQGGTFKEGGAGTIVVTAQTAGTGGSTSSVTIDGGTFEFADNTSGSNTGVDLGGKSLEQFLTDQATTSEVTHTVVVETDDQGHQTIVISDGDKPVVANSVIGAAADASINWINAGTTTETLTEDKKLAELQISQDYNQTLIIPEGKTLEVGRVVLGAKAQIVVEAGAKFIVTGAQGLAAFQESNLVLKTSESAQALFLFNPAVTSNTHPMATVEFISKSYLESGKTVYQRFGIPTYDNNVKLEYKDPASSVQTYITYWDYAIDNWDQGDWIPVPAATGMTIGVSAPFACFELVSNNAKADTMSYLFKGALVGNGDGAMTFNSQFNPYANSYMAPIDIKSFLDSIAEKYPELTASMYVYQSLANDNYTWTGVGLSDFVGWDTPAFTEIAPMQAYMLYLIPGNTSNAKISYKGNVYDPYITGANLAPARRNIAKKQNFLKLNIADENGVVFDNTRILEDNQFSEEFDNGYDINKFMNENVSVYVTSQDAAWHTLASDDIIDTYIGVNVAKSGIYTISIAHNGLDYALVDTENNQVISMVEGNTYSFYQEAGKNDTRFQVVKTQKVPTGIEDVQGNEILSTKVMKDGVLYIIKNSEVYNAQGQIIK